MKCDKKAISVESESKIKLGDLSRRLRERKSTTPLQENVSSSVVPPTIARKNITTRRSKSRKDLTPSSDPKELVKNKPRQRSRDRRYTIECGAADLEQFRESVGLVSEPNRTMRPHHPNTF